MRFLTAILAVCLSGSAAKLPGERTLEPTPQESLLASRPEGVVGQSGTRYTLYDGRVLPYEIIDGMAVHGGDMILGTAEEAARWSIAPEIGVQHPPRGLLTPRLASTVDEDRLWPGRTIPFTIDANVPDSVRQRITAAVDHWNDRTVLTLTRRTSQEDFVRFQMTDSGTCRATLGKAGGEQTVSLLETCDLQSVIHEIGHAVGLEHEHQREDRDKYITYYPERIDFTLDDQHTPTAPSIGPYNYASVMHYSEFGTSAAINAEPIFETIPPGMLMRQRDLHERQQGLSAGDVDAVARLYGVPPTGITLATNPPGLALVVDGVQVTAPRRYQWAQGSHHVIEAPLVQQASHPEIRYVFGRWSDGGTRSHRVTVDPDTTWLEANFIVQQRVDPEVIVAGRFPPGSEISGVRPPSADQYYTRRSSIELWADPTLGGPGAAGISFARWYTGWTFKFGGPSANPLRLLVAPKLLSLEVTFAQLPLLRLTTNVDHPVFAKIGGRNRQIPLNLFICTGNWTGCAISAGGTLEVSAPEMQDDNYRSGVRYRFQGWSDGEARSHAVFVPVGVPATGVDLKLHVGKEFELRTRTVGKGAIEISPASSDKFYPEGTRVNLQASAADGWSFVTWSRCLVGSDPNHGFQMDRFRQVEAVFSQARRLWSGSSLAFDLESTSYTYFPYLGEDAFYVNVPPGAEKLTVSAETSTPSGDLDMYVRRSLEVSQNFELTADYADDGTGPSREVVITRQSDPPLRPGPYFIALVSRTPFTSFEGQILARVEGSGPEPPSISLNPRALTFVAPASADPPPQRIELSNSGHAELRFTLGSKSAWLGAEPSQGTVRGGASVAIEVAPRSAGLQAGHYTGKLSVTSQADTTEPASSGGGTEPVDILAAADVTFVKLPAD